MKKYTNKEEYRVIQSSEVKTAQANGEFPKGHSRQSHENGTYVKVADPRQNGTYFEMLRRLYSLTQNK
jgi:hypothetical protein